MHLTLILFNYYKAIQIMNDITVKTTEELEAMNGEELLGLNIDSIGDLEGFSLRPAGQYAFDVTECGIEALGAEDKPAIIFKLSLTECIELVEDTDENRALVGELPREYRETYFLEGGKRMALKAFVTATRQLAQDNGWTTVQEIVENITGFSGQLLITTRTWKDKDTSEKREANQINAQTVTWL